MASEERKWQIENLHSFVNEYKPRNVLVVGYPVGMPMMIDLYPCQVTTVDPYADEADKVCKFESVVGGWDCVDMTSVLDYFVDPVRALQHVRRVCGRAVIIQGRLNTYRHQYFSTRYWAPTKDWLAEHLYRVVGCREQELHFLGEQMFCFVGTFKEQE